MTNIARKMLARVRAAMSLHVLAHGLKRVTRILGVGDMMRATSARVAQARISLEKLAPATSRATQTA